MNKMRWRKALVFALVMLPIAVAGSVLVVMNLYESYSEQLREQMIAQMGSYGNLIILGAVQGALYAFGAAFIGYVISDMVGLMRSLGLEKGKTIRAVVITAVCGVLFALDYPVFGKVIPELDGVYAGGITWINLVGSCLYGGFVEELLLRLFAMSLLVLVLWKLFARDRASGEIPQWVLVTANVMAAMLFAAGHIPATISLFGRLDFWILFRWFLLNGALGLVFGYFYRKWGIQYAFIGHFGCHLVSKLLLMLFL